MISKKFNSSFVPENKVRMNCRDIDFNIVLVRELMLLSHRITQFCRIKGCGCGVAPTNNFQKTRVTPTNYTSSEKEFIGESESFKISGKYFDFAIL